jgi:hypothetical protein
MSPFMRRGRATPNGTLTAYAREMNLNFLNLKSAFPDTETGHQ